MKKQFRLFAILLIIVFSIFNFANRTLFPAVNATYVEGQITQDTIWTLVDSPFVVAKDVIVCPGVTLTIEPEVEVRFGGNFSLIVKGRLIAIGTKDKMISFTSNKDKPKAGDWATIKFLGTQPSTLINCTIECGTNGITVENGTLKIQNSLVNLNSKNGIMMTNGDVEVKNNEITNNTGGIYIASNKRVTIQNNIIKLNRDGIILSGNSTSGINIYQNKVFNNRNGILLEADAYNNTLILNNTLSANSYGFYVSTNASTYITRNYVLNNTIGIYYEKGNHTAYFNDICGNTLYGMNALLIATVNATYNYWGDKSGPFHESLNPRGRGNRVGGDGVNIDFIPFLTVPIDYKNMRPTAILWTDKVLVAPNQTVTFIGTDSYDDGRVDQYFFDFGDKTNSSWTTLSLFAHSYSYTGNYTAKLKVMDDFGNESNEASTTIKVQNLKPLEASITLSNYTVCYNEEVLVTVYVSNGTGAAKNANVTLFSVKGGSFTPISGLTNSTGYFTSTFTAPNVTEVTNIRIIARASETNFADGSDYEYLKVLPPPIIEITAEPAIVKSEETATVTVYVTNVFEEPLAEVLLRLSSDNGSLSATTGVTNLNGSATFTFTAPQTLSQINVTIMVTAIKTGYAEGHNQRTIRVIPKILAVEVTANPAIIVSEAISTITAHVTYDEAPISNVTVTMSSDRGGNFGKITEITDSNGNAAFIFTAPQTTIRDGIKATITVTATKSGYVSGENQTMITIKAKVLAVQVTATSHVTISEAKLNVTVHVEYDMIPIVGANVTTMAENGYFPAPTGLTDIHGNTTFIFTAPQVNEQTNITITAQATMAGYAENQSQLKITVNPRTFNVQIIAPTIESGESATITVRAKCREDATLVAGATVNISSSDGNFSTITGVTDSDGYCTFIFNAPETTMQLPVAITANVTKNGYINGGNQTTITVIPKTIAETGGGWSIMTILLIIIPIAIAVIVIVLVKLKIIAFSFREE